MEGTLRWLRLIHLALMVSMLLYLYIMRMVPAGPSEMLNPTFLWALYITAVATLGMGQWMRSKQLPIAFETLRTKSDDAASLGRWRTGVIISDALAEAVVLYGFTVHMLGGTAKEVAPFFIAGLAAMLIWWPKQP
jgi:hypothetical protein